MSLELFCIPKCRPCGRSLFSFVPLPWMGHNPSCAFMLEKNSFAAQPINKPMANIIIFMALISFLVGSF